MKPSIGRIVHFQDGALLMAAIITFVHEDGKVDLCVFEADSFNRQAPVTSARFAITEGAAGEWGYWSWPPRV